MEFNKKYIMNNNIWFIYKEKRIISEKEISFLKKVLKKVSNDDIFFSEIILLDKEKIKGIYHINKNNKMYKYNFSYINGEIIKKLSSQ